MRTGLVILLLGELLVAPLVVAMADLPEVETIEGHPVRTVLPLDAIQALDDPPTVDARQADFMDAEELVLGVVVEGVARAYPLRHLDWHEVVNDRLAEQPIAVTW